MRERLDAWLIALALLIGALCLGYLSTRFNVSSDWSAGQRASLSAPSRAVLHKLDGPVRIVSYARPGGDLRPTVAAVIAKFQRFKPNITLSFVDPETDPQAMRRLGISVDGELIVHYKGHQERLDQLSERSLTNALTRLARGGDKLVAFVTGDGERNPGGQANADLGTFISQLSQRGIRAVPLNFSQASAVPQGTSLVVLASPVAQLAPGAVRALVDYVDTGGNLLWLTEPGSDELGLAPLATTLDIKRLPGMLLDGSGAALGLHDPRLLALGSYPPSAITRGFVMTTLFPEVAALAVTSDQDWNAQPLLASGPQSWLQAGAASADSAYAKAAGQTRGPFDFGFALSRLSPSPSHNQQRVVVIGDGDFLSNSYLGNGGNRALGERLFDWLLGDDALVDMPSRAAPDRIVRLSQGGLSAITAIFLVLLPLVLLLSGLLIAWRRRRR
ncbi:DUF4350 domain-containing protein [Oleiagrimonas sp. C23AA]|uniref:GldG family protein n=1 Tax=Oleiagrimonas sp. C23AA TaxID=2719047 RepID=UPI00142445BF|nr:DUF4350 domain-containing protein [Oleiagrimonas sp. C23AA]NII10740.1 GldG family protein [Oleiagrimonas sp. C23AA]